MINSSEATIAEIESMEDHLIMHGESKYFSLKDLFTRLIGYANINAKAGKIDRNHIISHETDPIIPRGIAKRTPVTTIASILCLIR